MSANTVLSYSELLAGNYPPPEPIINGLIEKGTVANWSAVWGTGKTWMALCAARAVASGLPFLDHFPTRQGSVLMLDQENTPGGLQERMRNLNLTTPVDNDIPIT